MTLVATNTVIAALTIWKEARGESYAAKLAVAWVIRNRTMNKDGRWPSSPSDVCWQPKQFSAWNANDVNSNKWPKSGDVVYADCCRAWEQAWASQADADPTAGANHYESLPPAGAAPRWADPSKRTARIGAFEFYKL